MFTPEPIGKRRSSLASSGDSENADRIITAVRVRPVSDSESNNNCRVIMIPAANEPGMCIVDPSFYQSNKKESERKIYERHFRYDHFFWSANKVGTVMVATQENVFSACGKPLVGHCVAGFNCAILAYGQTGTL